MHTLHLVTFVLSLLPVSLLEWLLTVFAYWQLLILSAKGVQTKALGETQEQKKKRKKKKSNKKRKSVDVGLVRQISSHQIGVPPGTSEVDVLGDSILFEANEQHRREFEGFLRSVKDIKDVQNWLKNFSNEAPRKVAIVKLSRRILDTEYGTTQAAAALSFMFKFGLYPIVVHGGWNELARDTISEVLARRKSFSQRLKAEIRKCGVGAAILTSDVCAVEPAIRPSANLFKETILRQGGFVSAVGEGRRASLHMEGGLGFQVNNIDYDRLTAYLERGKIPIWDGVAVTTDGAEVPLNGDVTTVELAHLLQPYRIIFACNDGGILDKDNKAIPVVYMDKDYEDLMSASWVSQRRKIQLLQLRRIVSVVPPSCTVVVTAIDSVTHQLMYPRLANETIVKRAEENVVHVIEDVNKVDKEQLKALIEDSFGRPLAAGYLDNLNSDLYRIYLITGMDGEYNGCAVIMHGVKWETSNDSDSEHSYTQHDTAANADSDSDHPNQDELHGPDPKAPDSQDGIDGAHPNGSVENRPDHTHVSAAMPPTIEHCDTTSTNSTNSTGGDDTYKFFYLCKFCVRKSAQGLGLGDLLWRSLQRDIDRLYWRSRTNNPLNSWYYARSQGSFRTNAHFTVFWYGDDKFEDGASLIADALARPLTILPVPT